MAPTKKTASKRKSKSSPVTRSLHHDAADMFVFTLQRVLHSPFGSLLLFILILACILLIDVLLVSNHLKAFLTLVGIECLLATIFTAAITTWLQSRKKQEDE